ncbi:hypothetical protein HGA11_31560 [Mycolicibacterium septicum DSM 44393]|uniref:Uncharacterized protein n=1 Tax=Mycolicibacterium septicum DSM 44393 TaxID=1341646 RepID=A0A7X6RZR3_9MYCO|nr:hypothetical protein [Mycolicibacterium septicum]NKZ15517.1 hypothetical protein [Mycolicibacterium septicum DSM 44393]
MLTSLAGQQGELHHGHFSVSMRTTPKSISIVGENFAPHGGIELNTASCDR